ncbi:MAG: alpha/beta fold hydrolase [Synechococcaceae cyanobacterium]|nr:alpha/beta fold hydrolase [Synechococcaceae cyanobacterium]
MKLRLPLLDTSFTVRVKELSRPEALLGGSSDLAELDRATGGAFGRKLVEFFQTPLPLTATAMVEQAVGTPLLEQTLLMASTLGEIDGLPPDVSGASLEQSLRRASAGGSLTMLGLLKALPGQTATVNLEQALLGLRRLANQMRPAKQLVTSLPARQASPALIGPGPLAVQQRTLELRVKHRDNPLSVVVVQPASGANGRLVLISHGLWDSPVSFNGWATHLASHGYTVLLPVHPGSDQGQQRAMLSGKTPPPPPQELRLRPLDVSAVIDAAQTNALTGLGTVDAARVAVLGHSWGATTALQLAGARPSSDQLRQRCNDVRDPDRNLSWVLQCSFIQSADRAGLADPRVITAVAVSPPFNLLFDPSVLASMPARTLVVGGSRDWVVTAAPEAIDRFAGSAPVGHQLVLVGGGDHFNLRGLPAQAGGPLRGLLLAWLNAAFTPGAITRPAPGLATLLPGDGWGDTALPIVAVPAAAGR